MKVKDNSKLEKQDKLCYNTQSQSSQEINYEPNTSKNFLNEIRKKG